MSQLITIVILCLSNYVFGNNDTLISIISLPNEETVIVDSITIDVINTFENVKTYTAVEKHIYHLGNKIRYKTKKNTIMKYLLFKEGDQFKLIYPSNWDSQIYKVGLADDLFIWENIKNIEGQYMGLLKFTPKGWSKTIETYKSLSKKNREKIHMTSLLQLIIEKKEIKIKTIPIKRKWFEFDNPSDFIVAKKMNLTK